MLNIYLFIITVTLVMIYFQMRFIVKVSMENHGKNYLAFNEQKITQALNELESSIVRLKRVKNEYDENLDKLKIKNDNKIDIDELEVDLKDYWQAEYEKEENDSIYKAMIEANIAVQMGYKTIDAVKLDFNRKFEFKTFNIMKKVEERWDEIKKN